jgi:RND family efflux transporter MFP subunit
MKKVLSAVVIASLMLLSYLVGRQRTAGNATASTSEHRVLYYVDPMHPSYHSDHPGTAPDCGMKLEPVYADEVGRATPTPAAARLDSGTIGIDPATQQMMGIRVATADKRSAPRAIRLLGRVVPEDTRIYHINAGSEGFVRETFNDSMGVLVKKDQKLATLYGPEYLVVASGFLATTAGVTPPGKDGARTMSFPGALNKQGISSLQGYTDRLLNLGMSASQIREMAENHQLPESIDVRSPVEGFIIDRKITPGQHFDRAAEFYRIADLTKVWILAETFDNDARSFRPGTVARVTLPGQGKSFSARVSDVLPQVDPASRTLQLRLEADNPGLALRPDMFVDVELTAAMPAALTVPVDAVIDSGREQRVFVERSSGVFEPRAVQTGWHSGDRVEIIRGLTEGERVVAAGTFMVDSESRLRSVSQTQQIESPKLVPRNADTEPKPVGKPTNVASDVKDPVCGMPLDAKSSHGAHTASYHGETFSFCSDSCQRKFLQNPAKYAGDKLGKATLPQHSLGHAAND